jgi:outer membrane protein OmpA-like peptidoglycan-associated protein
LEAVLALLRQTGAGMAGMRGDKTGIALVRAQPGSERHATVREEAELISTLTDALWTEVAVTERHLLRQTISLLSRRIVPAAAQTPRQELAEWTRVQAIFFSADATYRDANESARQLDALAALLKRTDVLLRLIGYTDDLGSPQRNSGVSTDRANKVRLGLIERGVAAQRLVAVGRPNGPNVSQFTGLNSPNRRVEFEVAFEQEKSGG